MIKKIFLFALLTISSFGADDLTAQKQDVLYVQNMIEIEENIAKNFEKYILTEFKIPTMLNLIDDKYLGSNFSVLNRMGENIDFKDSSKLQLKYAITKENIPDYLIQLYNRDLYRDYTSTDTSSSTDLFVQFDLKSVEANTIFDLLKAGNSMASSCSATLKNTYCNQSERTIRWYNASSQWIEYEKKDFNGNVKISTSGKDGVFASEPTKLNKIRVGAYIFENDVTKYIKNSLNDETFQYLKVD